MQAPGSLPEQRQTLESIYTFLSGARAFLDALQPTLSAYDRLTAENLSEFAQVCERKIIEAFPELRQWLDEWTRGGGR